jgi:hypothetical protein
MGVQVRQMATLSHLQAGPSRNEDVHPHRRELLEFSRSFRRKTVPHQIGQHLPRPHGQEKMPTTDGGSVECAKNRNRPPANSQERATILQHTPVWEMRKSCITATSDFKCPKAESIGSSNIHVSPTRWNYKVTGNSPAYLVRFVVGPLQFNRALCCRSSSSRCLRPHPPAQRSSRREVLLTGGVPLRLPNGGGGVGASSEDFVLGVLCVGRVSLAPCKGRPCPHTNPTPTYKRPGKQP